MAASLRTTAGMCVTLFCVALAYGASSPGTCTAVQLLSAVENHCADSNFLEAGRLLDSCTVHNPPDSIARKLAAHRALTQWHIQRITTQQLAETDSLTQSECSTCVVVAPFIAASADSTLAPLSRGLCDMVTTDLSQVKRLTLVERARVQCLFDEIALGQTGLIDETTAKKAGRLLDAAHIVAGSFARDGETFSLDAQIIPVKTGTARTGGTVLGKPADIFKLEKKLVFSLIDAFGIELSDNERRAVETIPTEDVLAFLAYSRGLGAEDRGDFSGAVEYYRAALERDPSFSRAQTAAERAGQRADAVRYLAQNEKKKAKSKTEDKIQTPQPAVQATPVFTLGPLRFQALSPGSFIAGDAVNAGLMPDRTLAGKSDRFARTPVSASSRANQQRDAFSDAHGAGLSGGGERISITVPVPQAN